MKPYYEEDGIQIYHGDCREVMPELTRVGLIVTDPPYVFGMVSTHAESKAGSWGDLMNAGGMYAGWIREFKRLLSNTVGAAWVFNSWRSFPVLARGAYESGWPIESLLVWDKDWIGPGGMRGLRPTYEVVALFAHPDYQIIDRGTPDIWRCKWAGAKEYHPAEKPIGLLSRMIEAGPCNGAVLDPFMGSGSTLVAAKLLKQPAIGIEIEEKYCETAVRRIKNTTPSLFKDEAEEGQVGKEEE